MGELGAWISFVPASDDPEPWDGILLEQRADRIEAIFMVSENRKLAQLLSDGSLLIADGQGVLRPSTDMAALGRAVYQSMTLKEPPA